MISSPPSLPFDSAPTRVPMIYPVGLVRVALTGITRQHTAGRELTHVIRQKYTHALEKKLRHDSTNPTENGCMVENV